MFTVAPAVWAQDAVIPIEVHHFVLGVPFSTVFAAFPQAVFPITEIDIGGVGVVGSEQVVDQVSQSEKVAGSVIGFGCLVVAVPADLAAGADMGMLVTTPGVQISRAVRDPDFKLFQVELHFEIADPDLFEVDVEEIPADFEGVFVDNFGFFEQSPEVGNHGTQRFSPHLFPLDPVHLDSCLEAQEIFPGTFRVVVAEETMIASAEDKSRFPEFFQGEPEPVCSGQSE